MGELARQRDRDAVAMTTDRWQHFTAEEREALVDALDHYLAQDGHDAAAGPLYDELVQLDGGDQEDDDGG